MLTNIQHTKYPKRFLFKRKVDVVHSGILRRKKMEDGIKMVILLTVVRS